jgi:hypothetical protein
MEVPIVKCRTSLCLLVLTVTVTVLGPGLCVAGEPPRDSIIECPLDGLLLRNVTYILPTWLVCAISDEQNPVGSDLPRVSDSQNTRGATQPDSLTSGEVGDTDRIFGPLSDKSGSSTETPRQGLTITLKL